MARCFGMALIGCLASLSFSGCRMMGLSSGPLSLIRDGKSLCVVIYDQNKPAEVFAFKELCELVKGTTGVELKGVDVSSPEAKVAKARVVIGRNALTKSLLGEAVLDSLRDQESLVTQRGDDLILTGGDDWGMIYAVYDFMENEAGYRCYAAYPGGELFVKSPDLAFSGRETRQRPVFDGFRICYTSPMMFRENIDGFAKFCFRNRGTRLFWDQYGKGKSFANHIGLENKYQRHVPGHGFNFFIPAYDREKCPWRDGALKGSFKDHPEYFTLDKNGKRVDGQQLCLSNPDVRELLTERVLAAMKAKGPGIYMVGSNDHSNTRYCWCPKCMALEKKYNSVGGPLWDYMLELCEAAKKQCPGAYVHTLAYKGPGQTEKAPDNIQFPDNFICDAAFLNSDKHLKEIPRMTLENGEEFDRFENLKKWGEIAKHVSYWYYGGGAPYQIFERMTEEIRELRDAGVKSVGACGLGSMEFGDITTYLYFRLLINPDLDAEELVKEFVDFKYGNAAPLMMTFIRELEQIRRNNVDDPTKHMNCDDGHDRMVFLEAEQILRWQRMFDQMQAMVKDDPVRARNVRIARTAVDCWTIVLMPKIRAEFPDVELNAQQILERGAKSDAEAFAAKMRGTRHTPAKQVFEDMSLYANLKSGDVPGELKGMPKERVFRYLPVKPPHWNAGKAGLSKDPDAVAQWTMQETVKDADKVRTGVPFEFYDAVHKQWLAKGELTKNDIVPGKYKLYKLFSCPLPSRCRLVFGGLWGTSLDIHKLGRYYDPSYQKRQFDYWASLKFEGPAFDPNSKSKKNTISCDQVFLVNKGMKE